MDITNINLGICPLQYLSIGYVGETGARPVAFDFSDWATEYGAGVLQLLLQRPGDANPYPVLLDIDGTTATWTPDATATEKPGQGQAQLVYTVGGVIVKNAIFRVLIAPSLGTAGDPPEPYEDWLERLLTIAAEAQQSALDAAGSAEAAGTSADLAAAAKTAAETAQAGAEAAKTGAEAAEQTAQQAAALARAKAAEAAEAAQIAGENADYAQQQRIMAEADAVDAHDSAESAAQSAEDAQAASSAAQTAASAAAASASAAAGSAADAAATVTEVETKGAEQITAINQAGTTQIAAVDAAGTAQVQAIEDKGEEVIASIPSDYTELIDDVSNLKSSIEALDSLVDRKAGMLVDSASGAIASFVPDATIENLLGLTVDIEPVQDLHGYDNPWPAGGSAQLLPTYTEDMTQSGITLIVNDDGSVTLNGAATATTVFQAPASTWQWDGVEDCWLSGCPAGGSFRNSYSLRVGAIASSYNFSTPNDGSGVRLSPSSSQANITDKALRFEIVVRSGTVCTNLTFKPMLNKGLSAQPFQPYKNICPISGWDAVEVEADGLNLFDVEKYRTMYSDYDFSVNSYRVKRIPLKPNTTYTVSMDSPIAQSDPILLLNNKSAINDIGYFNCRKAGKLSVTYVTDSTGNLYIGSLYSSDAAVSARLDEINLQIVTGSTASAYHPYAGNRYTIQLGQTVYGGTLDVTNGVLTVTMAEVDLGTLTWSMTSGNVFYNSTIQNKARKSQGVICSEYANPYTVNTGLNNMADKTVQNRTDTDVVYIKDTSYTDAATFKSAMSGVQLVYELITPITIQLGPVAIAAIAGQTNNVWADAGDVAVEYAADLKTYIDSKIAAAVAALS